MIRKVYEKKKWEGKTGYNSESCPLSVRTVKAVYWDSGIRILRMTALYFKDLITLQYQHSGAFQKESATPASVTGQNFK